VTSDCQSEFLCQDQSVWLSKEGTDGAEGLKNLWLSREKLTPGPYRRPINSGSIKSRESQGGGKKIWGGSFAAQGGGVRVRRGE